MGADQDGQGPGATAGLDALSTLVAARRSIERAERELRVQLRGLGVSWARLGHVYGISRQAARTRFGADQPDDSPTR